MGHYHINTFTCHIRQSWSVRRGTRTKQCSSSCFCCALSLSSPLPRKTKIQDKRQPRKTQSVKKLFQRLTPLLRICSLFILSTFQEDDDAGKGTAEHDLVSQRNRFYVPPHLKWCWRKSCPVFRYKECCDHPVCMYEYKRRRKFCAKLLWSNFLEASTHEVQVSTAAEKPVEVIEIPPDVNNKLVSISLTLGDCPKRRCPTEPNLACCFHPTCRDMKPRECAPFREGDLKNVSSNLLRDDAEVEASVTLCDIEAGSSETLTVDQLDTGEAVKIRSANCAFITHEEDSTVSCSDLAPHCDKRSLATIACWRLNWCPRKIGNKHSLLKSKEKTHGVCCFHPRYKNRASECNWTRKL